MLEIPDVLKTLLRRSWLLVLGLGFGALMGLLASSMMTPTYRSDIYLMVVTRSEQVENLAANDYTQAYSKLPTVPAVVGKVVQGYGIAPTSQAIDAVVTVEVPLNTPVFQIVVTSENREEAAGLANELGTEVSRFIEDRLAPGTGYRAVVVAEATSPQGPSSPDQTLNVLVGAALGLMLAGAIALFWGDGRRGGGPKGPFKDAHPAGSGDPGIWVPNGAPSAIQNGDRRVIRSEPGRAEGGTIGSFLLVVAMGAAMAWHGLRGDAKKASGSRSSADARRPRRTPSHGNA